MNVGDSQYQWARILQIYRISVLYIIAIFAITESKQKFKYEQTLNFRDAEMNVSIFLNFRFVNI